MSLYLPDERLTKLVQGRVVLVTVVEYDGLAFDFGEASVNEHTKAASTAKLYPTVFMMIKVRNLEWEDHQESARRQRQHNKHR